MRQNSMLGLAVVLSFGFGLVPAQGTPAKVFTCAIGKKTVSVTSADGRLIYRYETSSKEEVSIVGIPTSGNVYRMTQRFAGM